MSLSTDRAQSSQWSIDTDGPAEVTAHPDAADGLADGALCRLESRLGSMTAGSATTRARGRDVRDHPEGRPPP